MNFINNQAFCKSVFSIEDDCKLVRLFPQEKKEITFMKDLIGWSFIANGRREKNYLFQNMMQKKIIMSIFTLVVVTNLINRHEKLERDISETVNEKDW